MSDSTGAMRSMMMQGCRLNSILTRAFIFPNQSRFSYSPLSLPLKLSMKPLGHGLQSGMKAGLICRTLSQRITLVDVNSAPLSERICFGLPCKHIRHN